MSVSSADFTAFFQDEGKSIKIGECHYELVHVESCSLLKGELVSSVVYVLRHQGYCMTVAFFPPEADRLQHSFHGCYKDTAPGATQSINVWERGCGFLMWKFRLDWIFAEFPTQNLRRQHPGEECWQSRKICFHTLLTDVQFFTPIGWKSHEGIQGYHRKAERKIKKSFPSA